MLRTLIALSVVFGLIVADPLPKYSATHEDTFSHGLALAKTFGVGSALESEVVPVSTSLVGDVITAIFSHKVYALSLAVSAIGWLVSHAVHIIIGGVLTLGFCKLTGKCSLDYEVYEPVAQFRSLVTPERLRTAEGFLMRAMEKYSEEKRN